MKSIPVLLLLCCFAVESFSQSFEGVYTVGRTSLVARALSAKDRSEAFFNVVYAKGDPNGTMVSLTENPQFEFVFDEHAGDTYLGTFYFTKAWKGKPLAGYYVKRGSTRKVSVKFQAEAPAKP